MTLAYVQDGEVLTVPCPAAGSTVGQWMTINGVTGQCLNTTTSGLDLQFYLPKPGSVVRIAKVSGLIPALFDVAYLDTGTDQRLEAAGTPIGHYAAAALTGDTAARVQWNPALARGQVIETAVELDVEANATTVPVFIAPYAGKITGISYYTGAKPSSAAGTIVLTAQNAEVSDHTVLSTATVDVEAFTNDALTALTLTSTAADLVLPKGGVLEFSVVSNNADALNNEGVTFYVYFQRT